MKIQNINRKVAILLVVILFIFLVDIFAVYQSELYESASNYLSKELPLVEPIGEVKDISLPLLHYSYSYSQFSGDAILYFTVITNQSKEYVRLKMARNNGIWKVYDYNILDEKPKLFDVLAN